MVPQDVTPNPEVARVKWSPTAAVILGGYMNGASKACGGVKTGSGVSMVTKHAGKTFGACAVANLAIRNGLLRLCVPGTPMDDTVRTLDALASVPKTQVYSVNQMSIEHEMETDDRKRPQDRNRQDKAGAKDTAGARDVDNAAHAIADVDVMGLPIRV